jgi:hypothetical protein
MNVHSRSLTANLRFTDPPLPSIAASDLPFADRTQLTPLFSRLNLPAELREHVDAAVARNTQRLSRLQEAYAEIAPLFDHVLLKGLTHVPDFCPDPALRVQYDLDLYVPPSRKEEARNSLLKLNYAPIENQDDLAMDHLPTMVRKTGWQWRGDYFDPDLPPAVEIHFRFWDVETERLRAESIDDFWLRREGHQLSLPDKLGYACLHLTRHLLRGNIRPAHVWEIAYFLNTHHDAAFWRGWNQLHSRSVRRLEAVAFLLAKHWFAPSMPDAAEAEIDTLPPAVREWFEIYGWSPLDGILKPNKDEVWLHMSLLDSSSDRAAVLRRRLIPASLPGPVDAIHLPESELTLNRRIQRMSRNTGYALSRAAHHTRLFAPTIWDGIRWWFHTRS